MPLALTSGTRFPVAGAVLLATAGAMAEAAGCAMKAIGAAATVAGWIAAIVVVGAGCHVLAVFSDGRVAS